MSEQKKSWTFLIYANGNNDLEPEIWKSVKKIRNANSVSSLNVIIQVSRIEKQLVQIIRPYLNTSTHDDDWSGVRRYSYHTESFSLLETLEPVNMSDPNSLYDFIKWGMENYPAEHYMLTLGGHAYQLVGMMPDYIQNRPYILGFPEMCAAFEKVYSELNQKLDLLILDTCYCNCVEVLYELGKAEKTPVGNLLTYVGKGPLVGLPYDILLQELEKSSHINDIDSLTRKLSDAMNYDLVAFKIEPAKLASVKALCNDIAHTYLSNTLGITLTPGELITSMNPAFPWFSALCELRSLLQSLILCGKKVLGNSSAYINIQLPDLQDQSQLQRYYRLSFARDNAWTNLLSNKPLDYHFDLDIDTKMEPLPLSYEAVYTYISMMNAASAKEKWLSILKMVKEFRNWT